MHQLWQRCFTKWGDLSCQALYFINLHHVIISPRLQEYKYAVLQQQQEYDRLTSFHGHWASEKFMLIMMLLKPPLRWSDYPKQWACQLNRHYDSITIVILLYSIIALYFLKLSVHMPKRYQASHWLNTRAIIIADDSQLPFLNQCKVKLQDRDHAYSRSTVYLGERFHHLPAVPLSVAWVCRIWRNGRFPDAEFNLTQVSVVSNHKIIPLYVLATK